MNAGRALLRIDRRARLFAIVIFAVAIAGCGAGTTQTSTRQLGPGETWLPLADFSNGSLLCAGGGFIGDYRLHGDASDPRLAWMVEPDGTRTELGWPSGWSARFAPGLEILDDQGVVRAHEASLVEGGCETAKRGVLLVDFETPAPELPEPAMTVEP